MVAQDAEGNDIPPVGSSLNGFQGTYDSAGRAQQMFNYLRQWFSYLSCETIANGNETIVRCSTVRIST